MKTIVVAVPTEDLHNNLDELMFKKGKVYLFELGIENYFIEEDEAGFNNVMTANWFGKRFITLGYK